VHTFSTVKRDQEKAAYFDSREYQKKLREERKKQKKMRVSHSCMPLRLLLCVCVCL
jgi:hypothetical protein